MEKNPRLGLWLFLASEVMLFASLFAAYVLLRMGAESWPDQSAIVSVPLGSLNTAILIASSIAIARASATLTTGNLQRYRMYMLAAILLGMAFLGVKGTEYGDKLSQGLVPATNNFLGLYYTLTGIHALHVAGGLVINLFLLGPGVKMWTRDRQRFAHRVQIAGLYWQFVDLVWVALFVVLYLL